MRRIVAGCALASLLVAGAAARADEDDAACQASYVAGQRMYRLEHDLVGGREQLLVCAKTCPDELRASCGKWLQEIETEIPSIVVKAKDAHGRDVSAVTIDVDGKPVSGYVEGAPIQLNPGPHTILVAHDGKAAPAQQVVVQAGEKLRVVDVWLEPPPPVTYVTRTRRPVPAAAWVLLGTAAAGLASFGVFSVWTTVEYDATSSCTPTCAPSSRDGAFGAKTVVADVSLGVAAASLIAAGILYFTRPTITERVQVGLVRF